MRSKKWGRYVLVAALIMCLIPVCIASALEVRNGDSVYVPAGDIKGPLFVTGNNITVDANVSGDVFVAGQSVVINGLVAGDVIAAVNTASINGSVKGDVRVACNTLNLYGPVEGSVTGAGNTMYLKDKANIGRDVVIFGNTVEILGAVAGEVMGAANQMYLNAPIVGDVTIWDVQNLVVGPSGTIGGKVTYTSSNKAQISPDAKTGEIEQLTPKPSPVPEMKTKYFSWFGTFGQFAAGLLIWGAAYLLFPNMLSSLGRVGREAPWASIGIGFLAAVAVPVAALLLMITMIGMPLSFILMSAYFAVLILAKVIAGDAIGRLMAERFNWNVRGYQFLGFAVALLALILLSKILIFGFGFFVSLIAVCFAFGVIIMSFYRWRKGKQVPLSQPETALE
ncbi:MAG: hypothetical protein GT589_02110 [Peptoclostridium sp.]|uniref:polymer-forming cytoskeletal protein n=1 Tax=Peptoclostridium sp. TaxID=1904860 RepID=UPI00139C2E77|nr:polymer-forming cytoskeletal protein [Peptoclostridium sp.]MZQ74935.1 hypothetical protein [Peptoclostridium sp.]